MTTTGFEGREADWLGADEAVARVLAAATPLNPVDTPVAEALDLALAEEIVARATLPPWDNSAMDGYAVRARDIRGAAKDAPAVLPVDGVIRAGGDTVPTLSPGRAIRIMTGAPVPQGADTVVRVEDTDREAVPGTIRVFDGRDRKRHVRAAGQDMKAGMTLCTPGTTVTPGVIGVLAAAGRETVRIHRPPSVAVLATGDELRTVDRYEEVIRGAGVPESNSPMLSAMIRSLRCEPRSLGIATDDSGDLRTRIESATDADVLVTVGGASMGEADLVKRVLDDMGFRQDFWRVRMRPGSPISFGWLPRGGGRQPVFGLPGNPSSAFVTFEVFVRPFLLRLAGHRKVLRRRMTCVADERFETPADLTYFQRVTIEHRDGTSFARLTGPQLSGLVRGLAGADGLAIVPPERNAVEAGEAVEVMLLEVGPAAMASTVG